MKDKDIQRKMVRDRAWPDAAEISRYQDFGKITSSFHLVKKLIMKKIILSTVAVASIAAVTMALLKGNVTVTPQPRAATPVAAVAEAAIKPPLPGMDPRFSVYRVSARDGGIIRHFTGSELNIPAGAFVSDSGEVLADSVEVKYREFHDPLDIFLSGITMTYDSSGRKRTLESAGMLQVLAYSGAAPLSLRAGKEISVKMASASDDPGYNLYELDTVSRNWIYRGKDVVTKVARETTRRMSSRQESSANENELLLEPKLADPKKYSFTISYDTDAFPELAAYENVVFETDDKAFNARLYKVSWSSVSLAASEFPGAYVVRLKRADTSIAVLARPVFDEKHFHAALKAFERQHERTAATLQQKEEEKNAALAQANRELGAYNPRQMVSAARTMAQVRAFRVFRVQRLGTHNLDVPIPELSRFAAYFTPPERLPSGEPVSYNTIFLLEKGKNTVFRFPKGQRVEYDSRAEHLIWTVTDKNEIAFFSRADFRNPGVNAGNVKPVVAKNQEEALERIRKFSS